MDYRESHHARAQRAKRILDLCDLALELPVEDRERFLSDTCSGDDDLRQAVDALLEAVEDSGRFLAVDERD